MTVVAAWNIEHYGSAGYGRTPSYQGMHAFIAAYQTLVSADVLVIQEFKSPGGAKLPILTAGLGADWKSDWIKGALGANAQPANPNNLTPASLAWGSNSEGYGVLFRGASLQPLASQMFHGTGANNQEHYVELNTHGLETYAIGDWGFYLIKGTQKLTFYPVSGSPRLVVEPGWASKRQKLD